MTAKRIGVVNRENAGYQTLWKLEPPIVVDGESIDHVVTSEIDSSFGIECLVFKSTETGSIKDWGAIGGGEYMSAEQAIKTIGYNVTNDGLSTG